MNIVIQCAGRKDPDAGCLRTSDGRRVIFVSHPSQVSGASDYVYAHPDDVSETGQTWRERLLAYNQNPAGNPLHLLPAYRLYANPVYRALVSRVGIGNLFILSAGWGLIPAGFLTPAYDITFSSSADASRRRRESDRFEDWSLIDPHLSEALLFLGGKAYFPFFCKLTEDYQGPRVVLYNSRVPPRWEGVRSVPYETTTRTNWHYEAARAFLDGRLDLRGVL